MTTSNFHLELENRLVKFSTETVPSGRSVEACRYHAASP